VNPSGSESENEMLNYNTFFPKNCVLMEEKDTHTHTHTHTIYIYNKL